MTEMRLLIPGIYADDEESRVYINMREFTNHYGLPDKEELRTIIREELRDIFSPLEIFELFE